MAESTNNISTIIHRAFASRVQFGEVIYRPKGATGPRVQSQFQLVLVVRGEASIRLNDEPHQLSAGEVALLRPRGREFFQFSQGVETQHSWCSIDPPRVSPELQRDLKKVPFKLPISETMHQLITLGLRTGEGKEDEKLLRQLAVAALCAFVHEAQLVTQGPATPDALVRARQMIEKCYHEQLSLADVAQRSGLSSNHLIKLFRRYFHETPGHYLWRLRVEHGVRLLRETGLSISEIAYRTGFQNPFHFSRLVKKRHQLSPRGLRQRWWGSAKK